MPGKAVRAEGDLSVCSGDTVEVGAGIGAAGRGAEGARGGYQCAVCGGDGTGGGCVGAGSASGAQALRFACYGRRGKVKFDGERNREGRVFI